MTACPNEPHVCYVLCNGIEECSDGSDEPENCTSKLTLNPCTGKLPLKQIGTVFTQSIGTAKVLELLISLPYIS